MFDIIFIGLLVLFSAILVIEGIRKWRVTRQTGYLIGGLVSVIAGLLFIIDFSSGFYMLALAMIIRVVTGFVSRRDETELVERSSKTEDPEAR